MSNGLLPLVLGLLASFLPAQLASYTYYGVGCGGGPNNFERLWATGYPTPGGSVTIHGIGESGYASVVRRGGQAFLATGISRTNANGLILPWQIPSAVVNMTGCSLYASWEIFTWARSGEEVILGIPNDPTLLGLTLYQQWHVLNTVYNSTPYSWWQFSNGGTMTIGL